MDFTVFSAAQSINDPAGVVLQMADIVNLKRQFIEVNPTIDEKSD
jgi:hypothetical protein